MFSLRGLTDRKEYARYEGYEATGKIGEGHYGNGTATHYTYDPRSTRLVGIVTADPSGQPANDLQRRAYWYTQAGDVKKVTDGLQGIDYEYAYDNLHRLTGETNTGNYPAVGYTYNAIGNILTRTVGGNTYSYGYSGGHKHAVGTVTYNGTPYTYNYDNNGNMLTGPDFTDPGTTAARTMSWNGDNRPARVVHVKGGVTVTTDFAYDGTGGRAKKVVQGSNTTFYVGAHYEVKDGVVTKYLFAGSMRIAKVSGGATHYYHQDHLGSSVAMSDVNGSKVEGTEYMPFGSMRDHSGSAISNYKYTDQELDTETGLYYFHARYYDPVIGRFISADAIVQSYTDPQTLNRYSYVRNNPLIYTDPSGYFFGIDAIIVGAVIGALVAGVQSDWNPQSMVVGAAIGGISGGVFSGVSDAAIELAPILQSAVAGAAAGGTAGGLSAAYYGGDIGEAMVNGGMIGAIGGAAFGAIGGYYGKEWSMWRVGACTFAGGGVSELAGQGFERGAMFAGITAFARYTYNELVQYDAKWEPGKEAVRKEPYDMPIEDKINIGTQGGALNPDGLFNEGGRISRLLNTIPGTNATAGVHDVFQVKIDIFFGKGDVGALMRNVLNVPGMIPAAALSYGALMCDTRAMILYSIGKHRE